MITYMPLAQWPAPVLPLHPPFAHLDAIGFVPLGEGELLLAAHYYPLAVRLDGAVPVIGTLTSRDMIARSLITADGRWTGAYTPVALRAFPLRMRDAPTGDCIQDLDIARIAPGPVKPRGIKLKDEAGGPSKELLAIYDGLKALQQSQNRLASALDLLLVADVLVPLGARSSAKRPTFYAVDRQRFAKSANHTLEAMTRHAFTSIDLATVLTFSQVHLTADARPAIIAATTGADVAVPAEQSYGFEGILPWLDTSELFPTAWASDPDAWARTDGSPAATPAQISVRASPQPAD
jgi:SapC